jgi:O-antigen/teichoic acid export membrane protein
LLSGAKDLTSYGLRAYGGNLSQVLNGQLDRVLAVGLLSPGAMGLYVVALSFSMTLNVCWQAVVQVLFAKASGRPADEVVALTGQAVRGNVVVTLLAALGLEVLGPWLLSTIYGQEFLGAVKVFRILIPAMALSGTAQVLLRSFMALDRPGLVSVIQGIGVGLTAPLILVLTPRYDLEGVGLALLISGAAQFVLAVLSFPLILKVRVPRLWPTQADISAFAAAIESASSRSGESEHHLRRRP